MRADSLPEAKIAFENGLHWRKVFVLLAQMSASEAVVIETARKMAGMFACIVVYICMYLHVCMCVYIQ